MRAALAVVVAVLVFLFLPVAALAADVPTRPNVVVILADDLGYGDVHCFNPDRGKIPTPCIDRLAAEGMRFTDGHSSSGVCSPSRYALLTGRYHWRTRLQSGIVGVFGPPLIAADRVTIATLAREQGYHTACIGKWHLGWDWPVTREERQLLAPPRQEEAATNAAAKVNAKGGQRAAAATAVATERQVAAWREIFARPVPGGPTARGFDRYFGTDVPNWPPYCFIENDRTQGIPSEFLPARLLTDHQASNQGPALAGWTLEPILPALADRACDFIATAAREDRPFLLYLPLTSPHTPLAVNDQWRGKSGLGRYADFVMETDAAVGRVLDAIRAAGVADDTLVLLTSDNGFASYVGLKELEGRGHHPSGPLRGFKASAWEGGHRVPFIVRWPGVVTPGRTCNSLVHQADLIRTLAEIWGTILPDDAGEDSVSLLPLLVGGEEPVRDSAVSTSAAGVPAVRSGSWKYIAEPAPGDPAPVQLYDLAADLGETTNVAAGMPEKVADMEALLERLITAGRSTPGTRQRNDVEVVRHPRAAASPAKPRAKRAR